MFHVFFCFTDSTPFIFDDPFRQSCTAPGLGFDDLWHSPSHDVTQMSKISTWRIILISYWLVAIYIMEQDRARIPQTNCKWPNPKGFEPIGASQETILYIIYGYPTPKRPCWSLISFRRGYLIAPVQFLTVVPSDLGPEAVHEDFWLQRIWSSLEWW